LPRFTGPDPAKKKIKKKVSWDPIFLDCKLH
jgi:hypothetical protein